jgi:glycosyltransferase involved in cell wall biosynthesis
MKILFLHTKYTQPGGEDRGFHLGANLLSSKGHIVKSLIFENDENKNFVKNIRNGYRAIYNIQSYSDTIIEIEKFKPDIVHVHNLHLQASPSVIYAAKKMKVPVVMSIRNYRLLCCNALLLRNGKPCEICVSKNNPLDGIKNKCYRSSYAASALVTAITEIHRIKGTWSQAVDAYIFVTEFARQKFAESKLNIESSKLITQPDFTVDAGEATEKRDEFFLFAGRIATEKGVNTLLEAFKNLPQHKLIVAGDGPLKSELMEKYAYCSNIQFTQWFDNDKLIELMKKCKALIFPSIWYEGLPFTIMESFSTGTPVISSNIGAMKTMITDSYNGLHFEAGNVEDLKRVVRVFAENRKSHLYANARQTYLDHYSSEKYYESIIGVYSKLLCKQ